MLGYFPRSYPDELLYSICARYSDIMQYPNQGAVNLDLFGKENRIAKIVLATNLNRFVQVIPSGHSYSVDYFFKNHSLLPFYTSFMPVERKNNLKSLISQDTNYNLSRQLGIYNTRILPPDYLRFCPMCVQENRNVYGECYWHRLHQLPGVEICPIHLVRIENSSIKTRNKSEQFLFFSAEKVNNTISSHKQNLSSRNTQILLALAKGIEWLLNVDKLDINYETLHTSYMDILVSHNFVTANKTLRHQELKKAFNDFYPKKLLIQYSSTLDDRNSNWLTRLLSDPTKGHHPLRHLLLINFLGYTPEEFFNYSISKPQSLSQPEPFGKGPWPCMNTICSYYKKLIITNYKKVVSKHSKDLLGYFECFCGFSYRRNASDKLVEGQFKYQKVKLGVLWEATLQNLWEDPTINLTEMSTKLGVDKVTIKRYATKLGLPFPPSGSSTTTPGKAFSHRPKSGYTREIPRTQIFMKRELWFSVVTTHPDVSISKLRHNPILHTLHAWLKRNDKEWLESFDNQNRRKSPILDWDKRDEQLVKTVELSVFRLRNISDPPVRITITAIGRDINKLDLLRTKLQRLPLTAKILAEALETREDFIKRRNTLTTI